MAMTLKPIRRVVTGNDAQGRSRVLFDGPPDELASTGVNLGVHADDLPRWLEELAP